MTHSLVFNSKKSRRMAGLLGCLLLGVPSLVYGQSATSDSANSNDSDLGILAGVTWANHDVGSHVTWGGTAHYGIMPNLNIGLYFQRFTNTTTILNAGGLQYTTSYNFIAAEANYLFRDILPGAYAGGKFGWAITSVNLPNVNDKNNVVFGPAVGYDYILGNNVSLGGQFNILWRTGDPFITDVNLLALLKFHLFS